MSNTPPFIKSIQINKVRHLKNIFIDLDDLEPRHLILTGPNGSGKSSLLRNLVSYLDGIPNRTLLQIENWKLNINSYDAAIAQTEMQILAESDEMRIAGMQAQIASYRQGISGLKANLAQFDSVKPSLTDLSKMIDLYHEGKFLIAFFDAKRAARIDAVTGAQRLDLPKINAINVNQGTVGTRFVQFLVNQENRAALLMRKGDSSGVLQIQKWMDKITEKFRELFQRSDLVLDYDIDNFDFQIKIPGREPFRLVENQLSDGFSAVLQIIAELLMRMEAVTPNAFDYDTPGIVLIDEIETHLHIRLQKTILPFLCAFFPKIQFIVTTHSPFVLTSLSDAVVFDLERQSRWANMSPLSASTVVENYFDLDLYSEEFKRLMARLDELCQINRNDAEEDEFKSICKQFDDIKFEDAPELVAHYRSLRAKGASQ